MPHSPQLVNSLKLPGEFCDLDYYENTLRTKSMAFLISERGRLRDFLKHSGPSLSALPMQSGAGKFLKQTDRKVTAIEIEIGRRLASDSDDDAKESNKTR